VTLHISCKKLRCVEYDGTDNDSYVIVYAREEGHPEVQIGRTETKNNTSNPNFETSVDVNYWFEKEQFLRFEVMNANSSLKDNLIGEGEMPLAKVMACSRKCTIDLKKESDRDRGKLIIIPTRDGNCNDDVIIEMKVNLVGIKAWYACRDVEQPYLIIERVLDIPESVYEWWEEREEPLDRTVEEEEDGDGEGAELRSKSKDRKIVWEDKILQTMDNLQIGNTETIIVHRSKTFVD
jgi:hypothetical protein